MKKLMLLALLVNLGVVANSETISEIQGVKVNSTFVNKEVKDVIGVVTLVKNDTGFFIQSLKSDKDSKTSEGIYIENKAKFEVKPGQLVKVDGKVVETYISKPDPSQLTVTAISASKVEKVDNSKMYKIDPVVITGNYWI